jgi:phosphatidylglycerophosphate synthase
MLTKFRDFYERVTIPFGRASLSLRLTPNMWTLISLLCAVAAAILIAEAQFFWGMVMVVAMNLADMMDGATARAGQIGTDFGTVLDHVTDRYGEFLILGGLMAGGWISPVLGLFAASGVVMASYVRAKAESVGVKKCTVGLAGRQEKLILIYGGLICFGLQLNLIGQVMIFLVGVISHITTAQRLLYAQEQILGPKI